VTTRLLRSGLGLLALVLVAMVAMAGPASAHAQLERTDPADGTVLQDAPTEVRLTFSEGVGVADDGIRVVNGKGDRVDDGNAHGDGDGVVAVDVDDDLARGTYVVSWRVVSEDGHPIQGAFQFSVGEKSEVDAGLLADAEADPETGWQAVGAVLRGLVAAGSLLAVGGTVFLLLLSDRSLPAWASGARVVTIAAAVAIVASILGIPLQAVLVSGGGAAAMFDGEALGQAVGDGVGLAVSLTLAGLLLVVAALKVPPKRSPLVLALAGGWLTMLAFVVTGHTRSATSPAAMIASDLVHVTAGAAWFGGLVMLAIHLRAQRRADEPVPATEMVSKFSAMATWALLAVAAAGTALAWLEVRSLDALGSTTYGRLLLAKVAVVGLVALGGAYNRFGLLPSVVRQPDESGQWRRLGSVARFEAAGLVAALALTAVLVNVTPARDAAGVDKVVSTTVAFGTGTMQLVADPGRTGLNEIHFYFLDESGQVLPDFESLEVEFTLPAKSIGPIAHPASKAGTGHYQILGHLFEPGGRWTITAVARIDTFTQTRAVADVTIR
jgi:copper transport protein